MEKVKSGVTHGSVLGPLLFLIYIDDIDNSICNNLLKFADDTNVYGMVLDVNEINKLQVNLDNLCKWSQQSRHLRPVLTGHSSKQI